jgi:hypothetical protein
VPEGLTQVYEQYSSVRAYSWTVSSLHVGVTTDWIMPRSNDIHDVHAEFHENTSLGVCKTEPADG